MAYNQYNQQQHMHQQQHMQHQQQHMQPQQMQQFSGEANFDFAEAEQMRYPINTLTEVLNTRWFIKARLLEKNPVKQWNNAKGTGHLMSVVLIDDSGTAIRATFFKDGVDKFHDMLKEGNVYYFGAGRIKKAQKRFNNLPHDYEISFDGTSRVQPVQQTDQSVAVIPDKTEANWVAFKDLGDYEIGKSIDVRCVIKGVENVVQLKKKDGSGTLEKRGLRVVDNTCESCFELTIWGEEAVAFTGKVGQTLVSRNTRLGKFMDNIQLTAGKMDIDSPEAADLHAWWQGGGSTQAFDNVGGGVRGNYNRIGLEEIEKRGLGKNRDGPPDYMHMRGTVHALSDKGAPYYVACPFPRRDGKLDREGKPMICNKKVTQTGQQGPGQNYTCPEHDTVTKPSFRYIAQLRIGDHTGCQYVTMFDEVATPLLGMTAGAYAESTEFDIENATNNNTFAEVKRSIEWAPCTMTLRVKEEENPKDGITRVKLTVQRASVLRTESDFMKETLQLQKDIQRYFPTPPNTNITNTNDRYQLEKMH